MLMLDAYIFDGRHYMFFTPRYRYFFPRHFRLMLYSAWLPLMLSISFSSPASMLLMP